MKEAWRLAGHENLGSSSAILGDRGGEQPAGQRFSVSFPKNIF